MRTVQEIAAELEKVERRIFSEMMADKLDYKYMDKLKDQKRDLMEEFNRAKFLEQEGVV